MMGMLSHCHTVMTWDFIDLTNLQEDTKVDVQLHKRYEYTHTDIM